MTIAMFCLREPLLIDSQQMMVAVTVVAIATIQSVNHGIDMIFDYDYRYKIGICYCNPNVL